MTSLETQFYPEIRFGGFTDCDSTVAFYTRVRALAGGARLVVDYGCGRGSCAEDPIVFRRELRDLRGPNRHIIGIDIDTAAAQNPLIDEFRLLAPGVAWPIESSSVDLIVADFVLEHVADPDAVFAEAARVLAHGGHFCIRASNAASYVGLISWLIPRKLHHAVLRIAQPDRHENDVFPAAYACNTVWRLRRLLARHGFDAFVSGYNAEPAYLSFSRWAYGLGVAWQKHAPTSVAPALFAFARLEAK